MATTANTGFRYFKSILGQGEQPIPFRIRIANSAVLRVGDLCRVNNAGFLVVAAAGVPVAGVVAGITDENGVNPLSLGVTNATGGTFAGDDQITAASDNQTRQHYAVAEVYIDVAGTMLFLNKTDGALAQTNLFQMFDADTNGRQITVSTASDSNGVMQLIELDPEATGGATADSTKGLFRIHENQFGMGIDTGTAKVAA